MIGGIGPRTIGINLKTERATLIAVREVERDMPISTVQWNIMFDEYVSHALKETLDEIVF